MRIGELEMRPGMAFESEFGASLNHYGKMYNFFWQKLVDTNLFDFSLRCPNCGMKYTHNLIIPKAIGDFILMGDQSTTVVECKSSKKGRFPLKNIAKHQMEFGVIIDSLERHNYMFAFNDRRMGGGFKCYVMSARDFVNLVERENPGGSVSWAMIEEYSFQLRRMPGAFWDVLPIVEYVTEV